MKKLNLIFGLLIAVAIVAPFVSTLPMLVGGALLLVAGSALAPKGVALMAIPIQDARSLFTKTLVAVYKEKISVMSFGRSFFKPVESMSKEISIEVRRGSEKYAVDVNRQSDGNYNKFSITSEKIFIPPYFYEYMVANDHRLYDVAIATQNVPNFAALTAELADDLNELKKKIERTYEKLCWEVLELGTATVNAGTSIDFKRKAASKVAYVAGNQFSNGANDPFAILQAGCNFLRKTGKAQGVVFNAIMGDTALSDFLNNTIVKGRADIWNFALDRIVMPQQNMVGASFHGEVSCGAYRVRIWTYSEYYDEAGVSTPYMNPKKVIILPENPDFILSFAAVPQLLGPNGEVAQKGAYLIGENIDYKKTAHEVYIKSAGVPIPVAVDQIYTVQVVS